MQDTIAEANSHRAIPENRAALREVRRKYSLATRVDCAVFRLEFYLLRHRLLPRRS